MLESVSLEVISRRLNRFSWQLLEILNQQQGLTKKELFEHLGEKSRRKFDIEYAKLYGASLLEEKQNDSDGRSLAVYLTEEGKTMLSIKENMIL